MSQRARDALAEAWTRGAPGRDKALSWPRGFWPDVAYVAICLALDEPIDIEQTRCGHGSWPEPAQKSKAKTRAENTAALLASLDLKL